MVGHQAVGQQRISRDVFQGFPEDTLKGGVIAALLKNGQPTISPVKDMVHITTQGNAMRSSHNQPL